MKTPDGFYWYKTHIINLLLGRLSIITAIMLCLLAPGRGAAAGTWSTLANPAPGGVNNALLLSDGTLMVGGLQNWYRLTPDIHGSYVNGTWSTLAPMYDSRLYYASDVLTNGKVFVAGGEYYTGGSKAELYDPARNTWTQIPNANAGFSDANSTTLPDGNVLLAPVASHGGCVIYNVISNTWQAAASTGDQNELSWARLPNDSILSIGVHYVPSLNQWINDANVPNWLSGYGFEFGAGLLLPNGKAFYIGATTNTATYTPGATATNAGTWVQSASMPNNLGAVDAPAAMMANGKILCALGPVTGFVGPVSFCEYDYTSDTFAQVNGPTGTTFNGVPYATTMLDLPDGSVLFIPQGSTTLYTYMPDGIPLAAGQPAISNITMNVDGSYHLTGTGLTGISAGAAYGDDQQMDSSYPLVRLTNNASGNIYYARTYNWSTTSVMTSNRPVATEFTLPGNMPSGTYSLVAVANGISSAPVTFNYAPPPAPALSATVGDKQLTISWNAVSGATSYNLKRAMVSGKFYVALTNTTGTSCIDAGLTNGTSYYYVVSAVGSGGPSTNSTELPAVPLGPPPTITTQPGNLTLLEGQAAVFTVAATGDLPLSYRWQLNGTNLTDGGKISGSTTTNLTISDLSLTNAGNYRVIVTNFTAAVSSSNATLSIASSVPIIVSQSGNQTPVLSGSAQFNVKVVGSKPYYYQWYFNSVALTGATNSILTLSHCQMTDVGIYYVAISNNLGSVVSSNVILTIHPPTGVVAWGSGSSGQINVPSGLLNPLAVAAGQSHSLALKNDGTVVAWGDNTYGQTSVPIGLSNVVAIAAGDYHSLALKADGRVVAWGRNDVNSYNNGQANVPAGLTNVVAIAGGYDHSLALKSNGAIVGWGNNYAGEAPPSSSLSNIVAIAAGQYYSLALKNNGTVVMFGSGSIPPASLTNALAIAASQPAGYALKSDGTVTTWNGSQNNIIAGLSNVVAIAAFENSGVLALKSDGTVTAWNGGSTVPTGLTNAVAIAIGGSHDLAIANLTNNGIIVQPVGQNVVLSNSAAFMVLAGGIPAYQWIFNGSDITNATNAALILTGVQLSQAGNYAVRVVYPSGTILSSNAVLTVYTSPVVVQQPASVSATAGTSVALAVTPVGVAPFAYQWSFGGTNIAGATNAVLTLTNVQLSQGGSYAVLVTNAYGSILSSNAILTVINPPANALVYQGDSAVFTVTASGGAPFTYQWRKNASALTNGVKISGANSNVLTLSNLFVGDAGIYTVTVSNAYSGATSYYVALRIWASSTVAAWGKDDNYQADPPYNLVNAVAIAGGYDHSLALRSDGTIVGWGNNYSGEAPSSSSLTGVVGIAAGSYYSLALKNDGTVVEFGQGSIPPAGLTNVLAIAAGGNHCLALKNNGTVVAWGANYLGQTNLPAGLINAVAIAGGLTHSLVLKNNGTVVAWGDNTYGQTNIPGGLTNVAAIAAGGLHSLVLKNDGTVVAWGDNSYGQTNVPPGLNNVVAITAGFYHSMALKSDGTMVAWGDNTYYQSYSHGEPNVVAIASGGFHNLAMDAIAPSILTQPINQTVAQGGTATFSVGVSGTGPLNYQWQRNGVNLTNSSRISGANSSTLTINPTGFTDAGIYRVNITSPYGALTSLHAALWMGPASGVLAWGGNWSGQTNVPANLSNAVMVAGGFAHSLALKNNGTVVAWGDNSYGQTNVPPGLNNVVAIAAGDYHCMALKNNGTVVAWGDNSYDQTSVPPGLNNVVGIGCGGYHSLAVKADGSVAAWGANWDGATDVPSDLTNAVAVSGGEYFSLAIRRDGMVVGWGPDWNGEIDIPPSLTNAAVVAGGGYYDHAVGLRSDGTVIAWGDNNFGETDVPPGLSNAVAIATGYYHVVAVKQDGAVVGWGGNWSGQADAPLGFKAISIAAGGSHNLAIGGWVPQILTQPANQAVAQGGTAMFSVGTSGTGPLSYQWQRNGVNLTNDSRISGANSNTLTMSSVGFADAGVYRLIITSPYGTATSLYAVLRNWTSGNVAAWGWSAYGQTNVPVNLTNAVAVSAGQYFNLSLKNDGTVVGWGLNNYGQASVPAGLTNIVAIAAGYSHSMALKNDGTVVAWGYDGGGQTDVPSGLTNVIIIAAGGTHSMALKNDGTVVAWGYNGNGQTDVPSGLSNVVGIAGGGTHSLALKNDGTAVVWGSNNWGQTNVPAGSTNLMAVAGGALDGLALKGNGTVVAWGYNGNGQTNVPAGLSNVVMIAAGGSHNLALKNNGTVVAWGANYYGQTNVPAGLVSVTGISGGYSCSLAIGGFAPVITTQPTNQTVAQGGAVIFSVGAGGTAPLSYQWRFNGTNLAGATIASLTLTNVQTANAGNYSVLVTNAFGLVLSSNASLSVSMPPQLTQSSSYLANIVIINPSPANLTAVVNGTDLQLTWPADHTGWRLLVQTSNLEAGLSLNTNDWSAIPGSTATNQVIISIDKTKAMEFYRLAYP